MPDSTSSSTGWDHLSSLLQAGLLLHCPRGYSLRDSGLLDEWKALAGVHSAYFYEPSGKAGEIPKISTGTYKNLRKGKSLGPHSLEKALNLMIRKDPGFRILFSLGNELPLPVPLPAGELPLLHGTWLEFHPSRQNGKPVYSKSVLIVSNPNDCNLYIDHPRAAGGRRLHYKGSYTCAANSFTFRLHCTDFEEEVFLRYSFSGRGSSAMSHFTGLCSGLSFDNRPFAAKSVIRRMEPHFKFDPDKLLPLEELPDDKSVFAELATGPLSTLDNPSGPGGHAEFFEFGPYSTTIHPRGWKDFDIVKPARALSQGGTIRLLTSYITEYQEFAQAIDLMRKDELKLDWQVILFDPGAGIFDSRYQLIGPGTDGARTASLNIEWHRTKMLDQIKLFRELSSGSVKLEVRYSPFWPAGAGYMYGDQVLYFGLMYTTATADGGPLIEVRDDTDALWRRFRNDFDTIWRLAAKDPISRGKARR